MSDLGLMAVTAVLIAVAFASGWALRGSVVPPPPTVEVRAPSVPAVAEEAVLVWHNFPDLTKEQVVGLVRSCRRIDGTFDVRRAYAQAETLEKLS